MTGHKALITWMDNLCVEWKRGELPTDRDMKKKARELKISVSKLEAVIIDIMYENQNN